MFDVAHAANCTVHHLPGRDWFYLLGPLNSATRNLTFGLAEFHPGEQAPAHSHDAQEEIIYILEGEGEFMAAGRREPLVPGTAIFIPIGLTHQIVPAANRPLKLVTLFSPPVVPGAYDNPGTQPQL